MSDYQILPFRFAHFNESEYLLTNDVGEYIFLCNEDFEKFIIKELDAKIAEGVAMGYSHIFCPIKTMLRPDKITYNLNGYIFIYATSEQPVQKIEGAPITKEAKRPIYVFDLDGKLLNVFLKISDCMSTYNLQAEGVRRCLSSGKPQYNGYIFRYSNAPLSEEELAAARENYAYRETSKVTS